jgi:hypothetical protein
MPKHLAFVGGGHAHLAPSGKVTAIAVPDEALKNHPATISTQQ